MFEHLDDSSPPVADRSTLAEVQRRGAALRARRRALTAAATALTVAVVAVLVVAIAVPSLRLSRLSSSETVFEFNQVVGPLTPGTPVPTTALADTVFPDARHGYALAEHQDTVLLATTADGGNAWQVVNGHLPPGYGGPAPAELVFTDVSHGYLWDGTPSASGMLPMWTTADGGRHWHQAAIGPVVYDVGAIGADVWALVDSCPLVAATWDRRCPLALEISADGGSTWSPTGASPGSVDDTSSPEPGRDVELARITTQRGYVLVVSRTGAAAPVGTPPVMTLAYTADGGASWADRTVPCTEGSGPLGRDASLGAELAASGTADLWLLCGGQGDSAAQSKALYRSADGGRTWTLTSWADPTLAGAGAGGTGPGAAPGPGGLPLGGYVAPISDGHANLAVLSPTSAWISPVRGGVYRTVDGGRTWQPVPALRKAGFGTGAPGNVTFIDGDDGWVCELGVGLWRTSDGTAWHPLGS